MRRALEQLLQAGEFIILNENIYTPTELQTNTWICDPKKRYFSKSSSFLDVLLNSTFKKSEIEFISEILLPCLRGKSFAKRFSDIFPASKTNAFHVQNFGLSIYSPGEELGYIENKAFKLAEVHTIPELLTKTPEIPLKGYPWKNASFIEEKGKIVLLRKLVPFTMNSGGESFSFSGPEIGIDLEINRFGARISKPYVRDNGYKHPFVYSDGKICFDDATNGRWERDAIHFNFDPNYCSIRFAEMVARTFEQARKNLMYGYKQGVRPVRYLNKETFSAEHISGGVNV